MLQLGIINRVFILSPGSLRSGWIKEYCKVCGMAPAYLNKYFTFITYNFDVNEQVKVLNFNNALLIIDEVHNLINGVKNNSVNATVIYKKAKDSDCRILALSGTPIVHNKEEWVFIGNLLKPNSFASYLEFVIDSEIKEETDSTVFDVTDEQLRGIISYFPGDQTMYPAVIHKEPIITLMSPLQAAKYTAMYKMELLMKRPKPELKYSNRAKYDKDLKDYIRSKKFERSRRVANFYYGNVQILNNEDVPIEMNLLKLPDILASRGGWVSDATLANKKLLVEYSAKFTEIIFNIAGALDTKHVVFSWYKSKGGVEILNTLLNKCNIKSHIFSGDLTDNSRIALLNRFNHPANNDGKLITVLLITDAGAEGINILATNNIHITESSKNQQRINQVIGRVVRYKSHINLPLYRQYVNVWRYWAQPEPGEIGLDEMLYNQGVEKIEAIDNFQERLIENSIENKS